MSKFHRVLPWASVQKNRRRRKNDDNNKLYVNIFYFETIVYSKNTVRIISISNVVEDEIIHRNVRNNYRRRRVVSARRAVVVTHKCTYIYNII